MTRMRANKSGTKMKSEIKEGTKSTNEETNSCMDPVYKTFLQHLRLDGTSYILEMKNKDKNAPLCLKYEAASQKAKSKPKSPKESKSSVRKRAEREEKLDDEKNDDEKLDDESYERFLNNMKIKDGYMVLDLESEGCLVYEEEEEENDSEDEEEILVTGERGVVPYFKPVGPNEDKNDETSLTFEEKLNAVLTGPYDQFEYEALMEEARHRKPLMKQRNLRHMSKRYRTRDFALSYFDHYPDLKIQISQASSNYERLSLLRKFFFWLENLCHEGAYMPWVPKALTDKPIFDEEQENVLPIAIARDENET
ncbi:hypothetical protein LUZ60_001878 [Juncus effusus]|nr:hypothetical protein LUZ60_001878 [Juncus effusus]